LGWPGVYACVMSTRARIAVYGSSVGLVLVGGVCAALVGGMAGELIAMAMIGSGLVILTGLVFMEVGLSEDRDRAREDRGRAREDRDREREDRDREREDRDRERPDPDRELASRRGSPAPSPRRRLEPGRPPRVRGHRHER